MNEWMNAWRKDGTNEWMNVIVLCGTVGWLRLMRMLRCKYLFYLTRQICNIWSMLRGIWCAMMSFKKIIEDLIVE